MCLGIMAFMSLDLQCLYTPRPERRAWLALASQR
jgi:hypothetical protein